MGVVGTRQLSLLALSVGMVAVGVAGLAGIVTLTPILAASLLAVAVVLAFDLGRTSTDLW